MSVVNTPQDPTMGLSSNDPVAVTSASTRVGFRTSAGTSLIGSLEGFANSARAQALRRRVRLVFTSPPFPLNRKKQYGNRLGEDFVEWFSSLAPTLADLLTRDGSLVIEMGNAWEPGEPVMSTTPLRALLAFAESGHLHLCQQFVAYNPARLPSPVQWVNIDRVRVKDAFTHIWWLARSPHPFANNREVLVPYSAAMASLLKNGTYNAGRRPSGHAIGAISFAHDNGGAIPSNVLAVPNTSAKEKYLTYCHDRSLPLHPARMHPDIPRFFIRLLTKPGDIVLDPFAGSNITGAVSEELGRRWVAVEPRYEYVLGSRGRFQRSIAAPILRKYERDHEAAQQRQRKLRRSRGEV